MTQPHDWIEPPQEFAGEDEIGDIEAYWDSASPDRNHRSGEGPGARYGSPPIQFTPLYVTLIDSDLGGRDGTPKSSTLIHGRLNAPCKLRSANKEEHEANGEMEFPAGTIVGIWTKSGMKELKKLAGANVWMANGQKIRGEVKYFKDLGQAGRSPMVLFTIRHTGEGKPIEVRNDYRDESLPDAAKARRERLKQLREERIESKPVDLDDIPF